MTAADLGATYAAERHKMVRFLMSRFGSDAEDALHDGVVKAIQRLHTYDGNAAISTWLTVIAKNKGRDAERREARQPDKEVRGAIPESRVADDLLQLAELEAGVQTAVQLLHPHWRTVLVEVMDGRTCGDVAAENGWTLQVTRNYLHLARVRMRELLTKFGVM